MRYQVLSARLADDRRALLEAQDRYDRGEVGLLPVLEARQLLYATEEAEVAGGLNRCLAWNPTVALGPNVGRPGGGGC